MWQTGVYEERKTQKVVDKSNSRQTARHTTAAETQTPTGWFLPFYRRWWTKPQCCLCSVPPPQQTLSLQTWQPTGSYCKAKGAQSWLCQRKFSSNAQHLLLENPGIGKDRLSPLWLEQPIACHICSYCTAVVLHQWINRTATVRQLLNWAENLNPFRYLQDYENMARSTSNVPVCPRSWPTKVTFSIIYWVLRV